MSFETVTFSKIPVDFQEKFIGSITKIIKSGESVQIVGAPGSGNSLVVKALTQSEAIQKKHFGNVISKEYLFLRLDGTMLLERKISNLYRLFLSLFLTDTTIPSDEIVLQNEIERAISEIVKNKKAVIFVDHLQELNFPNLKPFFVSLNQIFRRFEPNICFIFVTSKELKGNADLENFDTFGRVLLQNVLLTPPFDRKDAFWFMEEKGMQLRTSFSMDQKKKIFELSGGFPRTIKRLAESAVKFKLADVIKNPTIDPVLTLHLEALTNYEDVLTNIPLLRNYLDNKASQFDGESVGDTFFDRKLTKYEEKLYKLFIKNKGEIVRREEGIKYLWGDKAVDISDHAYDQLILRLRNKLKSATPSGRIETVRGRGHVFRI